LKKPGILRGAVESVGQAMGKALVILIYLPSPNVVRGCPDIVGPNASGENPGQQQQELLRDFHHAMLMSSWLPHSFHAHHPPSIPIA
jgi:hypothetical protein